MRENCNNNNNNNEISNKEVFQFLNIYFSCLFFILASRVQWNVTNVDFFKKPSAFEILYFFTLDNIPYFEFWTRNIQYLNTRNFFQIISNKIQLIFAQFFSLLVTIILVLYHLFNLPKKKRFFFPNPEPSINNRTISKAEKFVEPD